MAIEMGWAAALIEGDEAFRYLSEHPTAPTSLVAEHVTRKLGAAGLTAEEVAHIRSAVAKRGGVPGAYRASEGDVTRESTKAGEGVTVDEKRAYLREWALGLAKGNPDSLPVIREARQNVKDRFGATLGTDIIMRDLKAMKQELTRAQLGPAGVVGDITAQPVTPVSIRQLVGMMRELGIKAIVLDENDEMFELRRK